MSCLLDTKLHIFDCLFLAIELHIAFFKAIFAAIFTCPPGYSPPPLIAFLFFNHKYRNSSLPAVFFEPLFFSFPNSCSLPEALGVDY